MSAEENKALVRRVMEELFNEGNLGLADELIAPDYVDHDTGLPEDPRGPEGFKQFVSGYRTAFPDLHVEILEQITEGDRVATRWVATGTHQGYLGGIPPTGNRVRMPGMEVVHIADGKYAEEWEGYNLMEMMQQLGVIPTGEN